MKEIVDRVIQRITNWCRNHSRFRLILNRDGITPYLERYYIFIKDRKSFPINIVLHRFLSDDLDDLHDHPWNYATLIIKGGYWETTPEGRFWRGVGHFRMKKATSLHRINLEPDVETWTLFFMGKQKRKWGFMRDGVEWVEADQYLRERDLAQQGMDSE